MSTSMCVLSESLLRSAEQHLRWELEDVYPTALRMAVYHLGHREEPYLCEQSTVLLVKIHGLGPTVPHFLTQNRSPKVCRWICGGSGLCTSQHEQNGELWGVLRGAAFLEHHEARLHQSS